jgi:signal transduction histidine kinase
MTLSIRSRLLLAMNLLAIGVGVAVGWAGVYVSGRAIEQRLVDESARNAAGLFGMMRLPFSDGLMVRLRQVLGTEVAAGPVDRLEIVASSLPQPDVQELRSQLTQGVMPRRVSLGDRVYLVGGADAAERSVSPAGGRMRLYVLVPEEQIRAAQKASEESIILVTAAAILVATLVAFWLSHTIANPIRRLAGHMDRLSEHAGEDAPAADMGAALDRGPKELRRLAHSFDRLLARLLQARRQLARTARLATLGQVSASVAHELRNPLSGIKMNARVLADELAKAGLADDSLDRIIQEADRMVLYVAEFLDLAGKNAGPPEPHDLAMLPKVRLDEIGESVLAVAEGRCRHAGVEVQRRWDAAAPAVRAHGTQLRQAIFNLVQNALEAMPSGGALTLAAGPAEAGRVRFSVTDTGTGVCVPDGEDLFEPFFTTKPGGVGLGLYVCRRNIERHRGTVGYESSRTGTTFWFELPAAD